jgi:putative ABC transport system permease protein
MLKFLLKGLFRDRHRSLLPVIVTSIGVMLTVVFHAWLTGILGDSIEYNARFSSGHVKIMTKAYAENSDQMPNDLALLNSTEMIDSLQKMYPSFNWAERIHFAGLIDVPDEKGETLQQGTAVGFGIDLLSGKTDETNRMNIPASLKSGKLPQKQGEVLLSHLFAGKLKIKPGDKITLISSTMYGEMSMTNLTLCGTIEFGTAFLDRGTIIADLNDARKALNMENASGEILGFLNTGYFDNLVTAPVIKQFNGKYNSDTDEFKPVMKSLRDQNNMGFLVDYADMLLGILIFVFITAMSLILWNAGLLGGLRRYGEFGMRLAIGEEKNHVYKSLIYESFFIGITGSLIGVLMGLLIAWYLQVYGINLGMMMKNATILMPSVFKARIIPETLYIGFVPGVLSTLLGSMLSGIGIYKRQTAQLFKELQA